jgi:hypothetical protein
VLWPIRVNKESVLILYSDVAPYILKAAIALNTFYPNLILLAWLMDCNTLLRRLEPSFPK